MNAKDEFISHIKNHKVLCAIVQNAVLPVGFDAAAMESFLQKLDFKYHNGFGGQELYGTIWYADGTWSSRGEYDGSEWWDHHMCPAIPVELEPS